jgi:cytosine/adenosine deaminase-related metal-dependent hydrolase
MELDERLVTGLRGENRADDLFASITVDGMRSLGWKAGEITAGRQCDLVAIDISSPRFAGYEDTDATSWTVFVATPGDITDVVVSGRRVVEDGRHLMIENPRHELSDAIAALAS